MAKTNRDLEVEMERGAVECTLIDDEEGNWSIAANVGFSGFTEQKLQMVNWK